MNWTAKQESEYHAIHKRADELSAARAKSIEKVRDVMDRCLHDHGEGIDYSLVVLHAEAIRDALAPFDSGVRVEAA